MKNFLVHIFIIYDKMFVMEKAHIFTTMAEELRKITWPTKQEAMKLTVVVFIISLIVGAYLGIIDVLLTKVLEYLTKLK